MFNVGDLVVHAYLHFIFLIVEHKKDTKQVKAIKINGKYHQDGFYYLDVYGLTIDNGFRIQGIKNSNV